MASQYAGPHAAGPRKAGGKPVISLGATLIRDFSHEMHAIYRVSTLKFFALLPCGLGVDRGAWVHIHRLSAWQCLCALSLWAGLCATPAAQAEWATLSRTASRTIEIERSSIVVHHDGTVTANGRMTYAPEVARKRGFAVLVAFNRYDCDARTFSIIRRAYQDLDGRPADVEPPSGRTNLPSVEGSLDDALRTVACQRLAKAAESATVQPIADGNAPSIAPSIAPQLVAPLKGEVQRPSNQAEPPAKAPAPKPATAEKADATAARASGTSTAGVRVVLSGDASLDAAARAAVAARAKAHNAAASSSPPRATAAARATGGGHGATHAGASGHGAAHWSYEGAEGPEAWAHLDPAWTTCATGQRQSPIDIRDSIRVDLESIRFDYRPSTWNIVDNGHTVQVNVGPGNSLRVGGRDYQLIQFHFHRPSEERVAGRTYDMVAHLVHRSTEGKLAVVAVLIEPGELNAFFRTLWAYLPLERHDPVVPEVTLDLNDLLPATREYWTYMGSLTTPPCTEGVLWLVIKQPLKIAPEQLAIFARLYPMNARPIQTGHGRLIKESR